MTKAQLKLWVMILTFSRIPLILGFAVLAVIAFLCDAPLLNIPACLLLVLSAVTDLLDGYLARKYDVCSRLGAYADPLADKIFYLVSLPSLLFLVMYRGQFEHGLVLLVLSILFLFRDQWVSFLRSIGSEHNADVRANWSGKLRTAISFPVICAVYAFLAWFPTVPMAIVYTIEGAGILINLISIWIYTLQYLPYLKLSFAQEE